MRLNIFFVPESGEALAQIVEIWRKLARSIDPSWTVRGQLETRLNAGLGSTITSRSRSTTTRCRPSCCARRSGRGLLRARSRSSTAARALPHMCVRPRTANIRRCASTCRRATGAMPTGRRSGCGGRPARSAAAPQRSSTLSCGSARTPSKASAPGSASSASPRPMAGRERLEASCSRALDIGARSYSSVNSILKNGLDRRRSAMPADGPAITHYNIRGPNYFH
jgi:hypothetical protein